MSAAVPRRRLAERARACWVARSELRAAAAAAAAHVLLPHMLTLRHRRAKLSKHPLASGTTLDSLRAQAAVLQHKYSAAGQRGQSPFVAPGAGKHAGADQEADFGILPHDVSEDRSAWLAEAKKGHGVPLSGEWPARGGGRCLAQGLP